jgi:uncharacterized protein GlcG (DUF336 family)
MNAVVTQSLIGHRLASTVCQAVIDKADELGARVNVAVVDRSGRLTAFLRHPDAAFHSSDIAVDKAYTAVSFGVPTHQWPEVMSSMSEAVQKGMLLRDRFIAFGGGLPISLDGELIGGVGVSGGSEEQDQACAEAALAAIDAG